MDYGGELPARVVIEHDEEDHSYRIFLETVAADGKLSFKAVRYYYCEQEAVEDYQERLGAVRKGVRHRERA
jgi:hypothetical protein